MGLSRALVIAALVLSASAAWTKKRKLPAGNKQRATVAEGPQKSFVKRINSTHAWTSELDDELKDIFHRIRKKATGMSSLSQEAALLQVERIRKKTNNKYFAPIVKAEAYAEANREQYALEREKAGKKLNHALDQDAVRQKVTSIVNANKAWVVESPDMPLEQVRDSMKTVYI